jgi:hypothetical protein
MLQAILSAVRMRPCPSARSPPVQRIPRRIVLDMPGLKARHIRLERVSNVRRRAGSRTRRSRIGDFGGCRRRIAGSVRSRIVPLCDACGWEAGIEQEQMSVLQSGSKNTLKPGGALAGQVRQPITTSSARDTSRAVDAR